MKGETAPERCPLCGGETGPGETVFTVDLGFGVLVVRHVPATCCRTCGETWIADKVAARLERMVENARRDHADVEVLAFTE